MQREIQVKSILINIRVKTFVKLIVDCVLNHQLLAMPADSAISKLLSVAKVRRLDMPLEAVVSVRQGLLPNPDYPIAAIAADADGLQVGDAYWLRADPVHLMLQRDSFSLSEPVPLQVTHAHAEKIITSLNQHFKADDMIFVLGKSGAWYLRLEQQPDIQTSLPAVALDRNIYQFMPTGVNASKWLSYINQVQMLLHEHTVNDARESMHAPAINSVWFSGGGLMPQQVAAENGACLILADSPWYQGLAKHSGASIAPLDLNWTSMLDQKYAEVRVALSAQHLSDEAHFNALWELLGTKKIQHLVLNFGCFEKTLLATIKPIDRYKFWRKNKTVSDYLL